MGIKHLSGSIARDAVRDPFTSCMYLFGAYTSNGIALLLQPKGTANKIQIYNAFYFELKCVAIFVDLLGGKCA